MRPIEYRTDVDFQQALRCVEYRLPKRANLKESGMLLALSLRYGLMGAAAVHHLLLMANDDEERLVLDSMSNWSTVVADHFRFDVAPRLAFPTEPEVASQVGRLAQHPIEISVPLYRRMCPLEVCLTVAVDDFMMHHSKEIRTGWNFLMRGRAERVFREVAEQSVEFASHFFERRQYDLEEVPEIALLGE